MNEEYLWDRRGSDPEIAGLEATLGVFRASSNRAPTIPQKEKRWSVWFASFGIRTAAATFATVAVVVFAGLLYIDPGTDAGSPAVSAPRIEVPAKTAGPLSGPEAAVVKTAVEVPETDAVSEKDVKEVAVVNAHRPPARTRKAQTPAPKPKDRLEGFSDEEKAAYEQLMLALSITSSSFRIMQDKLGANSEGIPLVGRETDTIRSN